MTCETCARPECSDMCMIARAQANHVLKRERDRRYRARHDLRSRNRGYSRKCRAKKKLEVGEK